MLGFHWNLQLSNGLNWTQGVKQQQIQRWAGTPPCAPSLITKDPDRLGIQLDIKIITALTLGTNSTRHVLAPKGWTSTFVYTAQITFGGSSRIYYRSPRFCTKVDRSTTRTVKILIILLITSLEIPARSGFTYAAAQHKSTKRVQVNVANMNVYNGANPSFSCLLEQKH